MKGLKVGDQVSHLVLKERKCFVGGSGSGKHRYWVCACVCGREVVRREDVFSPGKSMSCGCQHPAKMATGSKSKIWRGVGDLTGQYFGSIRGRAAKHGHEFAITIQDAWGLFVAQDGKCALTGEPLAFASLRQRRRGIQQTASLDRIDSTRGYVTGNVWWVHSEVNLMKNAFPLERFVEVCRLVTRHYAAGSLPATMSKPSDSEPTLAG